MHLTLPGLDLGASLIEALDEGFAFGDGKPKTALEIAAIEAGLAPYLGAAKRPGRHRDPAERRRGRARAV
jgi:hypothetical protein